MWYTSGKEANHSHVHMPNSQVRIDISLPVEGCYAFNGNGSLFAGLPAQHALHPKSAVLCRFDGKEKYKKTKEHPDEPTTYRFFQTCVHKNN